MPHLMCPPKGDGMIFMSQSGITDPTREKGWDAWYLDHLRIMVTVQGIGSAQRFKTKTTGYPSSLAMYSIFSAEVFQDPYYQSVRGMGDWLPLIDKKQYCRNLFEGPDIAPAVLEDHLLIIADRAAPEAKTDGIEFIWLKAIASTARRLIGALPWWSVPSRTRFTRTIRFAFTFRQQHATSSADESSLCTDRRRLWIHRTSVGRAATRQRRVAGCRAVPPAAGTARAVSPPQRGLDRCRGLPSPTLRIAGDHARFLLRALRPSCERARAGRY